MKLFLKKISSPLIITLALFISLTVLGGIITTTSAPAATSYTLEDIYNLIHNNTTSVAGDHPLSATANPTATSSYSVSQIYADLANLIKQENVATGTTYLGVTGKYGTPDPAYATTTVITSSLHATGTPGSSYGYSLEDIYQLITSDTKTTAGTHTNTPVTPPASSMHTLTDIYNALVSLGISKAPFVSPTKTYLGQVGTLCTTDGLTGFHTGDGSPESPYQICNWTHLSNVRNHLNDNFILTRNLSSAISDYSGLGDAWVPIGDDNDGNKFEGNFDGGNKIISDLTINSNLSYRGLFGYVTGNIVSLGVTNINFVLSPGAAFTGGLAGYQDSGEIMYSYTSGNIDSDNAWTGGLVGWSNGTISGCHSGVDITGDGTEVGGLVGEVGDGTISNSYTTGDISGYLYVGGFVGWQAGGSITNSYSSGQITASGFSIGNPTAIGGFVGKQNNGDIGLSYSYGRVNGYNDTGGFVGTQDGGASIFKSYSTSEVSGYNNVGGFVGFQTGGLIQDSYAMGNTDGTAYVGGFAGYSASTIDKVYSIGQVTGDSDFGGLIGINGAGAATNSFWDIDTSGQLISASGVGTTTLAMQTPSTFTNVGWLETIWNLVLDQYPSLK